MLCARCQTNGRLLADRALSRLLKADSPRTLEELEAPSGAEDLAVAQARVYFFAAAFGLRVLTKRKLASRYGARLA